MKIQLGKTYRDTITEFVGKATGEVHYISGCDQVLLMPKVDKDGKKLDGEWFDVQRVEEVKAKSVKLDNHKTPGFDQPAPKN